MPKLRALAARLLRLSETRSERKPISPNQGHNYVHKNLPICARDTGPGTQANAERPYFRYRARSVHAGLNTWCLALIVYNFGVDEYKQIAIVWCVGEPASQS